MSIFKYNVAKVKGIPVIEVFRYLFCLVFSDRCRYNIKEIYRQCKKRRGRSRYLLSVDITVGDEAIPAKIVCVRNKSRKKDWLAIICTDTTISKEEIIRIYGKRWDIEVFFKACKSYLHLIKECRSLSYDALTAHVSIVFAWYMCCLLHSGAILMAKRYANCISALWTNWMISLSANPWELL